MDRLGQLSLLAWQPDGWCVSYSVLGFKDKPWLLFLAALTVLGS